MADRALADAGRLAFPHVDAGRYNVTIDVRRNVVVVIAGERASADTEAAFVARYGPSVTVAVTAVGGPACTRDGCGPVLRSGLRITNDDAAWPNYYCSSGFAARRWVNEWALLTAAHCDFEPVDGRWAKHGGVHYGYREVQQQRNDVDAEWHRVVWNGFSAQPTIWVSPTETARAVRAKGTWDGLANGAYLCKSGVTTGVTCGFVNSKYFSPYWAPGSTKFINSDMCMDGGDSGSGVYIGNKAIGILSGGIHGTCPRTGATQTIIGHVSFAESALGVSVVTTDPAPSFTDVDAYLGGAEIFAFFSEGLDCLTVSAVDFTATVRIQGISQPLTITSAACTYPYDSVITLRVSLAGAPIAFVTGMSVSVSRTGIVQDSVGNEAYRTTRSASVTNPPE